MSRHRLRAARWRRRAAAAAVALGIACIGPAAAQTARDPAGGVVTGGVDFGRFRIGPAGGRTTVSQLALPVGVVFPLGRLTVDLGTAWVRSSLEDPTGARRTVTSLADTELRGSLTLGRDAVVLSLLLNLPTGLDRAAVEDFPVLGAISSSFLALPVPSHGSGFSATSGVAVALPAGAWNVGLAGSVRMSARYTPYADPAGELTLKPGVEGRVRAGVDRLIGNARVTGGLTYSTFGTDEFGAGALGSGFYRPGARWIAEAGVVGRLGPRMTLGVHGWHFRRQDGDSVGRGVGNAEQLTAGGAVAGFALGRIDLQAGVDGRLTRLGDADGHLVGGFVGAAIAVGTRLSVVPRVRLDRGRLGPSGARASVEGMSVSVFLRTWY
jgi:hypothetical protein